MSNELKYLWGPCGEGVSARAGLTPLGFLSRPTFLLHTNSTKVFCFVSARLALNFRLLHYGLSVPKRAWSEK